MRSLVIGAAAGGLGIALLRLAGFPGFGPAEPPAVARIVAARQAKYKILLRLDRAIHVALRQSPPDRAAVDSAARAAKQLALQIPSWFPPGTGPDDGARTYARTEIWTDRAGFRARSQALADVFGRLDQAAQSGNVEAMTAEQSEIGPACKACHESYAVQF